MSFMKRLLLGILLLAANLYTNAQLSVSRNWNWVTGGYSPGQVNFTINECVTDSFNNVYIAGFYTDSVRFAGQSYQALRGHSSFGGQRKSSNLFLAKIDSSGTLSWFRTLPGSTLMLGGGLVLDKAGSTGKPGSGGNVYVSFGFCDWIFPGNDSTISRSGHPDIGLAKFSVSGNLQWTKTWGTRGGELVSNLAIDSNDHLFFTGAFSTDLPASIVTINFGNFGLTNTGGSSAQFLVKTDTSGTVLWAKKIAEPAAFNSNMAKVRTNLRTGEVYVTSGFTALTNFCGTQLSTRRSTSTQDMYLAKFDNSGNFQWLRSAGSTGSSSGYALIGTDIAFDKSNHVYLIGAEGRHDFDSIIFDNGMFIRIGPGFLAKYNRAGQMAWAKAVGQHYAGALQYTQTMPLGIAIDDRDRVFVAGRFAERAVFGNDTLAGPRYGYYYPFVAWYDTSGNTVMGETTTGARAGISSVSVTRTGSVYVSGFSDYIYQNLTSLYFGTHSFTFPQQDDGAFVAKLHVPYPKSSSVVSKVLQDEDEPLVYPNPANTEVSIIMRRTNFENIEIIDMQGRVLMQVKAAPKYQEIALSAIANGNYFIRFSGKNGVVTKIISVYH